MPHAVAGGIGKLGFESSSGDCPEKGWQEMNGDNYTMRGARPDLAPLAKISTLSQRGYAFPKLMPIVVMTEKGGNFSHAPVGMTTAKGQKSRANGATIENTAIASETATWTPATLEGRAIIYEREVKALGGIENADAFGGEESGRKAFNSAEQDSADMFFSATRRAAATEMADHEVVLTLQQLALSVRKYGKPFLVMSSNAFLAFCEIPEIRDRSFAALGGTGNLAFLALSDEQLLASLSRLIKFQGIILFDSEVIGTDYDDYVGVVGLREEAFVGGKDALMTAKRAATYALSFFYQPDESAADTPFRLSSSDDRTTLKANVYDAEAEFVEKELHTSAAVLASFAASYSEYARVAVSLDKLDNLLGPGTTKGAKGVNGAKGKKKAAAPATDGAGGDAGGSEGGGGEE